MMPRPTRSLPPLHTSWLLIFAAIFFLSSNGVSAAKNCGNLTGDACIECTAKNKEDDNDYIDYCSGGSGGGCTNDSVECGYGGGSFLPAWVSGRWKGWKALSRKRHGILDGAALPDALRACVSRLLWPACKPKKPLFRASHGQGPHMAHGKRKKKKGKMKKGKKEGKERRKEKIKDRRNGRRKERKKKRKKERKKERKK